MANELITGAEITIEHQDGMNIYHANKQAMDLIKTLPDEEFEKEVSELDFDQQVFVRMARGR